VEEASAITGPKSDKTDDNPFFDKNRGPFNKPDDEDDVNVGIEPHLALNERFWPWTETLSPRMRIVTVLMPAIIAIFMSVFFRLMGLFDFVLEVPWPNWVVSAGDSLITVFYVGALVTFSVRLVRGSRLPEKWRYIDLVNAFGVSLSFLYLLCVVWIVMWFFTPWHEALGQFWVPAFTVLDFLFLYEFLKYMSVPWVPRPYPSKWDKLPYTVTNAYVQKVCYLKLAETNMNVIGEVLSRAWESTYDNLPTLVDDPKTWQASVKAAGPDIIAALHHNLAVPNDSLMISIRSIQTLNVLGRTYGDPP